jgi:23S rRNA-/tRNA-specific pseudouridylate synthase
MSNIDIAGVYVMKKENIESQVIWRKLTSESRKKLANEEVTIKSYFGQMRLDSQNVPKYHGQYDPSSTKPAFDVDDAEKILQENKIKAREIPAANVSPSEPEVHISVAKEETAVDLDEVNQLFPKRTALKSTSFSHPGVFEVGQEKDEWLHRVRRDGKDPDIPAEIRQYRQQRKEVERRQEEISIMEGLKLSKNSPLRSMDEVTQEINEMNSESPEEVEEKTTSSEKLPISGAQKETEKEKPAEDEKPKAHEDLADQEMTAYEFVQGMKKGKIEIRDEKLREQFKESDTSALDSQGFQSYKNYVLDLTKMRKNELLWYLKKNIIFCDSGILAINKPYGLIVQGKLKKHENSHHDPVFAKLSDDFADLLVNEGILPYKPDKLHIIHRLDKDTTGVLVLAYDSDKAKQLHEIFEKRNVIKNYLTIVRGVPDHHEGIIDIPMELGSVDGLERMVLRPELREELRRIVSPSKMARRAVTNYRVLDYKANTSLLQVTPETGVKHQIRVHLGFGLRTPVLGDHKYTYLEKIAPQKLPSDMLTSLNVRPTKVRNIPLHLHALSMVLPGVGMDEANIFLKAPVPPFFRNTMKKLKLRD